MGLFSRFFGSSRSDRPVAREPEPTYRVEVVREDPSRIREVAVFTGSLTDAPADAICTSTNPRLSLSAGTGGAVRERGGWEIKRACEAILESEQRRSGRPVLPVGSAHVTTAGSLPYRAVIHCVASDAAHHSSAAIVRSCVERALERAAELECRRVAMPLFATGHAALPFDESLRAIAEALRDAVTTVDQVTIVVNDRERAERAAARLAPAFVEGDTTR